MDDIGDISIREAAEQVLALRKPDEIDTLVSKLMDPVSMGINQVSELTVLSQQATEAKLQSNSAFNFIEMSHVLAIRKWALARSNPVEDRDDRQKRGRQSEGKGRSRSPRHSSEGKGKGKSKSKSKHKGRNDWHDDRDSRKGGRERRPSPDKSLLWAAVEKGEEETVKKLIDDNVDIEEKFKGWSPLMKAAEEDRVAILRMLLEAKADVEVANRKGRTALSFAANPSMDRKTAVGTLRLLLEVDADASRKDERGITPKAQAVREKRKDALDIFAEFEK